MSVLLLAEVAGGALALDATAKAATAAAKLGSVTALVCGSPEAAAEAAGIDGIDKVLHCADDAVANGLAENVTALVMQLSAGVTHIVAPASNAGKNVLPRVAALLDAMVITDVTDILDAQTFKRPIYAGNAIQTVRSQDAVKVLSIRTAGFEAAGTGDAAPVEAVALAEVPTLSVHLEDMVVKSDRPELASAKVVVSGGRGVGSQADFALISGLADKLGAAVGASRAAVDSGFAANDLQVGQTGKVVAPDLYVAVGISGAIQHLAGMKDSKVIVAINKDEEAPIFQVADYGLVADLFEAVPELTGTL
ncbi:FAD-binding protein [Paracoccus sp. 1_MG-2023]|uniref:electron transfer flavoprotein subunit alpha/FixB family protein n=1 Tax=unclassified Paracoccus (in: a-proteobacteria) TaxID=2688777 RepID=UPI001C083B75|nr:MULTISPECIES: FAD-binding protein [unclassified Paracoccus (in: a-proteobacteria)]MBU2957697.1 FAD-binding protein [Paracoccus sp. C2R09]MDO6667455.1 FAD-binding protein [Paracoccus sp. 1_MG-2023]